MSEQPTNTNTTILGPDCRINGEVTLDNDAVIMGQFQGTLKVSGELEIAESAQINGSIMAGTIRIAGQVEANVAATEGIEILPGGQLIGKLYTTNLQIVEGAIFQGDVYVGADAIDRAQIEPDQQPEARKTRPRHLIGQRHDQRQADTSRRPASDDGSIRTVPSALDSVLQKRRAAKVLAARTGQPDASAAIGSPSPAAKGGPTDES